VKAIGSADPVEEVKVGFENRRRLRISAETRSQWLITRCKNSQPFGILSHPSRPIAVENEADGVCALARRYRRRIAATVRFQTLPDRPLVACLPIFGLRNEFVATRRDQLQAARRLPPQQFFAGSFLFAVGQVGRPGRHRGADFVVEQDAVRGAQCRKRVIFDVPAMPCRLTTAEVTCGSSPVINRAMSKPCPSRFIETIG
jgi:hypothetical protein